MDSRSYYDYKILEHLEDSPFITHRMAAMKLNVSVKLTHTVVQGLLKRGLIHATKRDGRSLFYFLTPKGIAEKVRLTYEFFTFTHQFFREARRRSSEVCRDLAVAGIKRIAFLGSGELAEISYLGVTEHGLKLTQVFDDGNVGNNFMGIAVSPCSHISKYEAGSNGKHFERILVASFDPTQPMQEHYVPSGIEVDDRFVWVFDQEQMIKQIEESAPSPGTEE